MDNQAVDAETLILVIDDDPDICALVQLTLKNEGYEVITKQDHGEGLQAFRKNSAKIKLVQRIYRR